MEACPAPGAVHPDIVPTDVLAADAGRGLMAADCATMLDGYLRRLARQEARARRVLGTLARGFLRRHHHHDLGFARLRDYTRERLGLSARALQTLAHVVDVMARLPAIGNAFDSGEINWSQARCLVALATPENAPFWLLVARLRTVRALEAGVARKAGRRVAEDTIDGEERVRVRLPCPRHVRARWGQVQVLARCVCGSELAPWHAAEAIAAEGLSARGVEPDDPLAGLPEPPPRPLPEDEGRDVLPALDWSAVQEALPDDVEALARGRSPSAASSTRSSGRSPYATRAERRPVPRPSAPGSCGPSGKCVRTRSTPTSRFTPPSPSPSSSAAPSPASPCPPSRPGGASSVSSTTCTRSGARSPATGIPSSRAMAGAARSRHARRAGICTITISSSAPAAAATRATTASPSAPGTTCAASTRAACEPGARRRTPSPGSWAAARDSRRCSRWRATATWTHEHPHDEARGERRHRESHAHRPRLVAERHRMLPRRDEHGAEGDVRAVERRWPVVDVRSEEHTSELQSLT